MFLGLLISMYFLAVPAPPAVATCTQPPAVGLPAHGAGNPCEQETVFLLHGLGRTSRSMKRLERELARHGYRVHNLDLATKSESIESLADDVS
jgi:alpha-beta hydrolase superfamily lysophospholipase